jgi:hypothetical protein
LPKPPMKGPYERLKYDLRRLWECPVCQRRERTAGSVTFRHCLCQMQALDGKPVVMKLVADGVQRLTPQVVLYHEPLPAPPVQPAITDLAEAASDMPAADGT